MLERELHTRMELEKQLAVEKQEILKLKYEAKTSSLEQKLKEKSQLLSSIQDSVPSEVFGSTVQTMTDTPSFVTKENSNCTHSVSTMGSSPVYTQNLFQGPPPLFTPYLLNARQLCTLPTSSVSSRTMAYRRTSMLTIHRCMAPVGLLPSMLCRRRLLVASTPLPAG